MNEFIKKLETVEYAVLLVKVVTFLYYDEPCYPKQKDKIAGLH
jgi:hypothetical protein